LLQGRFVVVGRDSEGQLRTEVFGYPPPLSVGSLIVQIVIETLAAHKQA
jgi:hypothetical protein